MMAWNILKPTQPYFVFDMDEFYQELYLKQGISHFYSCHTKESKVIRVVPDGCIDLSFEYNGAKMRSFACGTPAVYREEIRPEYHDVFGVRFMPGAQPALINVTMRELFDKRISLEPILCGDRTWLENLEKETDFYQRIRIFIEAYTKEEKKKELPFGKKALAESVKKMAYQSGGCVRISEMADKTGYSERYINKIFMEEMGFSPKTFCKIIQFQRTLELLNYGAPDKMTDAAVELGYYDQPQFIRDFIKYAGITPNQYLKLVKEEKYASKVRNGG